MARVARVALVCIWPGLVCIVAGAGVWPVAGFVNRWRWWPLAGGSWWPVASRFITRWRWWPIGWRWWPVGWSRWRWSWRVTRWGCWRGVAGGLALGLAGGAGGRWRGAVGRCQGWRGLQAK